MPNQLRNLFIDSLSQPVRTSLLGRCVPGHLPVGKALYEPEQHPRYVYFLTSGVASVMMTTADGETVEVGLFGREGFSGSLHLLGKGAVSTCCVMLSDGNALRIDFAAFAALFESVAEIRTRTLEVIQTQVLILSQLVGCNRLHTVEQRLSRLLLMVLDRADSNMLTLTQELMSESLGTRRTTVTVSAGRLQEQRIIEYRRGRLRVLDRTNLKQVACTCYPVMQQLYLNLYEEAGRHDEPWLNYLPAISSPQAANLLDNLSLTRKDHSHDFDFIPPKVRYIPCASGSATLTSV
jgi:CRP-like cAMP-binding protein